jgi:hypothetical protein
METVKLIDLTYRSHDCKIESPAVEIIKSSDFSELESSVSNKILYQLADRNNYPGFIVDSSVLTNKFYAVLIGSVYDEEDTIFIDIDKSGLFEDSTVQENLIDKKDSIEFNDNNQITSIADLQNHIKMNISKVKVDCEPNFFTLIFLNQVSFKNITFTDKVSGEVKYLLERSS